MSRMSASAAATFVQRDDATKMVRFAWVPVVQTGTTFSTFVVKTTRRHCVDYGMFSTAFKMVNSLKHEDIEDVMINYRGAVWRNVERIANIRIDDSMKQLGFASMESSENGGKMVYIFVQLTPEQVTQLVSRTPSFRTIEQVSFDDLLSLYNMEDTRRLEHRPPTDVNVFADLLHFGCMLKNVKDFTQTSASMLETIYCRTYDGKCREIRIDEVCTTVLATAA